MFDMLEEESLELPEGDTGSLSAMDLRGENERKVEKDKGSKGR